MRTPTWASSEMAPYLQSGKWNRESRAGGRGYQCVYESERVLLCRKTLVWELGSPDHLLCPRTPGALTADRGHGGSDHHNRGVSCPPCGLPLKCCPASCPCFHDLVLRHVYNERLCAGSQRPISFHCEGHTEVIIVTSLLTVFCFFACLNSIPTHGPKSKGQRGSISGTRNVCVGVIHVVALKWALASRPGTIYDTGVHPAISYLDD